MRLQGRRYEVDAYEEVRPDAYCSRCCGWGHIGPRCTAAAPRCALCKESHTTADHRCPVEGCRVEQGHPCPHGVAKCKNCGGPHPSQANACPEKRRVWQEAKGWRSSPPLCKQQKAPHAQPGQVTTSEAAEGEEGILDDEEMAALLGVELGANSNPTNCRCSW